MLGAARERSGLTDEQSQQLADEERDVILPPWPDVATVVTPRELLDRI